MEFITYPQHIIWHVDLHNCTDAYNCFSKKTAKKIQKSLSLFQDAGYSFVQESVDDNYTKKFYPLYKDNIEKKDNPRVFNIPEEIEKKRLDGYPIEALSLYKGTTFLGGVIYRIFPEKITINYRTFIKEYEDVKPIINVSMIADYFIYTRALELEKSLVVHGKDRNLYGLHSNIGLPIFKMIAGAQPFSPILPIDQLFFKREKNDFIGETIENITTETTSIVPILEQNYFKANHGTLMFLGQTSGEPVSKAILFLKHTDEELLKKYELLFNNQYFTTEIITIDEQSPVQNPLLQNDREQ